MKLENWSIVTRITDPYLAPECSISLHGVIFDHPYIEDGNVITTSNIVAVEDGLVITRSGSKYNLGDPHPDYEARYPNAKERILNHQFHT